MVVSTASASFLLLANSSFAESNPSPDLDKTLSPYFFVKSDDPSIDQLPLKSTDVKVNITGVIADVVVTQHYQNMGTRPLEAKYVFPASSHAAVYAMQMHIGDRVVEAKIREKKQAKAEYEQAKSEGKSASLL
jgi:Ca-activated chloride channel homolog